MSNNITDKHAEIDMSPEAMIGRLKKSAALYRMSLKLGKFRPANVPQFVDAENELLPLPEELIRDDDGFIRVAGSRVGLFHLVSLHRAKGLDAIELNKHFYMKHDRHVSVCYLMQVLKFYEENRAVIDPLVDYYDQDGCPASSRCSKSRE
ncbi:MAG: hypothetical protein QGF00_15690 [Planctomycetota bacterium]|nr:hypothetical protein [Planctomycetota bacterium]MDP7251047.1 hypothetical protein [Planctomycetota bacterium]